MYLPENYWQDNCSNLSKLEALASEAKSTNQCRLGIDVGGVIASGDTYRYELSDIVNFGQIKKIFGRLFTKIVSFVYSPDNSATSSSLPNTAVICPGSQPAQRGYTINEDTQLEKESKITDECIQAIKILVNDVNSPFKGPENVFIVSKAGEKMAEKTRKWFEEEKIYERTGLIKENVFFCKLREQKRPIVDKLGITHFIDDRWSVLKHLGNNNSDDVKMHKRYLFACEHHADNDVPDANVVFNGNGKQDVKIESTISDQNVVRVTDWNEILADLKCGVVAS